MEDIARRGREAVWRIQDAFMDRATCGVALSEWKNKYPEWGWLCIPDTMDPLGPKGGGR